MPHSHHSHSGSFCRHAKGTLEQVVLTAISQGFKLYGLTEHAPRYRQEDLYPEEADLSPTDLHDIYLSFLLEAHRLRAVYSSQITLIVGLETDLISPLDLTGLDTLLTTHASHIDYIVGSLHHVHQTPIDFDRPTFDHALDLYRDKGGMAGLVGDYLDGQYEVLSVLRPEVVGHVDLIKLWNPELKLKDLEGVWEKVERNVRFAVAYGALFELNAAAFRKGWEEAYPSWEILQLIVSLQGRLCFSDDSHGPLAVGLNYHRLYHYLRQHDITQIWYLSLDDPDPSAHPVDPETARIREDKRSGRVTARPVEGVWWDDPFWAECVKRNEGSG